jgi:tetratricopeptide (TPR) repeat protein
MPTETFFDLKAAHEYFSAFCFNQAWDFMDKADRSALEDAEMIRLSHASLFHWTQREDCTDRSLSIGYWQISRIYALLNRPQEARRYADLCLQYSEGESPFYQGYAYEALARSVKIMGNGDEAQSFLQRAQQLLEQIKDPDEREMLAKDLGTLV